VEQHPADFRAVAQLIGNVPSDGFAFAIRVRRQKDVGGSLGHLLQLRQRLPLAPDRDVLGREAVLDVDSELALGQIRGFKTRFHLYTVPGQVFYDASRKLILKGVDGVVFVADSQIERMEANLESLDNLKLNLAEQGYELEKTPYIVQYNKRDLPNAAPLDEIRKLLNPTGAPDFEACATVGQGVFETLKAVARSVLRDLKKMSQ